MLSDAACACSIFFDDSASFDEYEYQDSEASGYYRYRVELKNGDTLRLWLPYYQVDETPIRRHFF
ncbi:MAG: hypothetical protein ACLTSF_09415 [Acutalibacteraceae bacterium]